MFNLDKKGVAQEEFILSKMAKEESLSHSVSNIIYYKWKERECLDVQEICTSWKGMGVKLEKLETEEDSVSCRSGCDQLGGVGNSPPPPLELEGPRCEDRSRLNYSSRENSLIEEISIFK